jgi:prepilin-type N-terminal cleavage/methylation domain-containing protein
MRTCKKGFTLIELLIVIAIIGILAVAFLPSLLGAPAKGRDAQRLATVQKITNFLVSKSLTGSIPATAVTGCIDKAGGAGTIGDFVKTNLSDFGGVYPEDPQATNVTTGADPECTGQYGFIIFADGVGYTYGVYAAVEENENANIACESIKAAGPIVLTPGEVAAPEVGKANCYLSLVQL